MFVIATFFSSRNLGVRVSFGLLGCYRLFSSSFRIVVVLNQFFVLHPLSVPHEITVVPLK
jgi:hypothetical protein